MTQFKLFPDSVGIPTYKPKPEHVRNRLGYFLEIMREAEHWP